MQLLCMSFQFKLIINISICLQIDKKLYQLVNPFMYMFKFDACHSFMQIMGVWAVDEFKLVSIIALPIQIKSLELFVLNSHNTLMKFCSRLKWIVDICLCNYISIYNRSNKWIITVSCKTGLSTPCCMHLYTFWYFFYIL